MKQDTLKFKVGKTALRSDKRPSSLLSYRTHIPTMDKVICNGLFTPESQQEAVPEKDAGQQPPY